MIYNSAVETEIPGPGPAYATTEDTLIDVGMDSRVHAREIAQCQR